jgi:acyl-CoA synthetase (AMP-forming)/AMP-acid ligase II
MTFLNGETYVPGRQLLPVVVDERDPQWLFARVPKSPTHLQDGFVDITCGSFARAVNRIAGWLEDRFGRSSSFETLAYLGPSDIRYCMFILGASKVGYKVKIHNISPITL